MPITVGELLQMPHLQLRLHSGAGGLDRPVAWTHTTDLPEPWTWVTGGELLMTNGMPVPRTAGGQEHLIRQLAEHGAAALAIGERMYCPPLRKRLATISDRLDFPVLWISYPMPFVAISRAVAEATLLEQSQRLIRTERIYQALQKTSATTAGLTVLTEALSRELGCAVRVCDKSSGHGWHPHDTPLPGKVRQAVAGRLGQLRAGVVTAPLDDGRRVLLVDIPTHPDAVLVALPSPEAYPDALLLQHAATVCALALSQVRLTVEHMRRTGAELLLQILDSRLSPAAAAQHLGKAGIALAEAVCTAARNTEEPDRIRDLHLRLWRAGLPHITAPRAGVSLTILPGTKEAIGTLAQAVGDGGQVGVSDPIAAPERIGDAAREATWALDVAAERGEAIVTYATAEPVLGPRNPAEAQALIDRILRPVLELPAEQSAELLTTLRAFLDHGRSWRRTAEALVVHRQTVLYRIRRIERLTGRRVSNTADLAALWLALRALELSRTSADNRPQPT